MTDPDDVTGRGAIGPLSFLVLGVIVAVFGVLLVTGDNVPLGVASLVVGVGLVVFGGVAEAVKLGVRSARRPDPPEPRL